MSAVSAAVLSCGGHHADNEHEVSKPPRKAALEDGCVRFALSGSHVRSCCGFCSGPDAMALVPVTASRTLAFFVRTFLPPSLVDAFEENDIDDSGSTG